MTNCPNVPLALIGIMAFQVKPKEPDCFDLGYEARVAGLSMHQCPYRPFSYEWEGWQAGYSVSDLEGRNP